ncbi:DUF2726 domain-containing protein [Providencia rettgeri]|uniref:DUF2726 domain-containing protein n=1 Tax=Providencia rettgeri TaxID=587 RepID=UPI00301663FC
MDFIFWAVILVGIGYFLGIQKGAGNSKKYYKQKTSKTAARDDDYPLDMIGVKVFKNSRCDDKDALFWAMIGDGVQLIGKDYLTTVTEKNYYDNLVSWFGKTCCVHCQVSLGRLFIFPKQDDFTEEEQKRFFSIYNHMSLDFVLTSKFDNKIVCVIELDDKTHEAEKRKQRDNMLDCLLNKVNIPYLHVTVESLNDKPRVWDVYKKIKTEKYD